MKKSFALLLLTLGMLKPAAAFNWPDTLSDLYTNTQDIPWIQNSLQPTQGTHLNNFKKVVEQKFDDPQGGIDEHSFVAYQADAPNPDCTDDRPDHFYIELYAHGDTIKAANYYVDYACSED